VSVISDILLAPDVRPFAVAAAIMASLGGIELLSMLVGFSIGELFGKDVEVEAPTATTRSAACFSGSMRGACRS
jgi:hypothetical protein